MPALRNVDELRDWLNSHPIDWASAIAVRSALRILPMIGSANTFNPALFSPMCLAIFRANFVLWCLARISSEDNLDFGIRQAAAAASGAANLAHDFTGDYAGRAALLTVSTALQVIKNSYPGYPTALATELAAKPGAGLIWAAAEADADFLLRSSAAATGQSASAQLLASSLWPGITPDPIAKIWRRTVNRLHSLGEKFDTWTEWYERRLAGREQGFDLSREEDEALMRHFASKDDTFWVRAPVEVNVSIADWLDSRDRSSDVAVERDFFISYASSDEGLSREVDQVLRSNGYSTFVAFKDIGTSANFVREMQRGLSVSSRLIALLSPDYERSDHCQAEWAAAYALDPGSAEGKIVPFLIRPTELNPLARQIVYTDLVGRDRESRERAILAAVMHVQQRCPPRQIRAKAAEVASPVVEEKAGAIDAKPNPVFDLPRADDSLVDLPATLREIAATIADSLPGNAPPIVRPCLTRYASHLLERGSQPILGLLNAWMSPLDKEFHAVEFDYWGAGMADLFAIFFAKHALFITNFPRNPERERFLSETPIDEAKACGELLIRPVEEASDALTKLSASGFTTPDFDAVVADQKIQARDLATLPLEMAPQPPTIITPKRRFVLGQIGFYERTIIALGALAAVTASPLVPPAIAALETAVQRLLALVL